MDAALQSFLDATSAYELEEFVSASLTSVRWSGHDVIVDIAICGQGRSDQRWVLCCADVRDGCIRGGPAVDRVDLETDHPLLLPYASPVVELHFKNRPADVSYTIGQLVEAHARIAGDWFGWTRFLNGRSPDGVRRLLEGGFGIFADGPRPLVEAYAQVLLACGSAVSFLPERRPAWWDGTRWVEETTPLHILLLGDSYFVSPLVTAERR